MSLIKASKINKFYQMNKREQELVAAFFEEIYEAEEVLDFIKTQLNNSHLFSPRVLFHHVSGGEENITIQRMRDYLQDRVAANQRELYEIFERFDCSRQGFISSTDFLNEIVPFGRKIDNNSTKETPISSEIEGHFISLFVEILKRLRILDVARKQIRSIAPYDAFAQIDHLRTGALGVGALRRFLQENDFNVTDRQLYYLLHGLRRRCYRDINLEVFCENLDPLEFGEYSAYYSQLEQERQQNYLRRSRHEEESMRRSRIQAQRVEHQLQKAERKRQAQLQRQLQLQDRVTAQMMAQHAANQRQVRRVILQQDKSLRHHLAAGEDFLRHQHIRNIEQRRQNEFLNSRRLLQEERNAALAQSALKRQKELQRSRRALQRERQLSYRQEVERERQVARQAALERELQQSKKRIFQQSRKRYEQEAQIRLQAENRRRYEEQLARKRYEQGLKRQYEVESRRFAERQQEIGKRIEQPLRSRVERELELEKLRAREDLNSRMTSNKASEYQKQLQRTRYDIQRSRFGESRSPGSSFK